MPFTDILHKLGGEFHRLNLTPLLVGGWGLNALGIVRQTLDFDLMVAEGDLAKVDAAIAAVGYRRVFKNELFAKYQPPSGEKLPEIDCLFCPVDTYARLAARGKKVRLSGAECIVPVPEDLLAMKLHALKHGQESRRTKDLGDAMELISLAKVDIFTPGFEAFCRRYGNASILRRLRDEAKRRP